MRTIMHFLIYSFLILFTLSNKGFAQSLLNIGLIPSSGQQRTIYSEIIARFQTVNPDIQARYHAYDMEEYKKSIRHILASNMFESDVLFWFAGTKLKILVEEGFIEPIDDLWQAQNWDESFTKSSKSSVCFNDKAYALPISYYQWGLYYKKSIFDKFDLILPTTWNQFINNCQTLKDNDITPITLGSKDGWPAAGWFDYLDLRINGLVFHKKLMQGDTAYTDERVRHVFEAWRSLIKSGYFLKNHSQLDWKECLPYLYRNRSAMVLMGNFFLSQVSNKEIIEDLGFVRFPKINPDLPYFEEAPVDILMIPKTAKHKTEAKRFLTFMAQPKIQSLLNHYTGQIPCNLKAPIGNDRFIRSGQKILSEAKGLSHFYDRDTPPEMYEPAMKLMVEFMDHPDQMDTILENLEKVRQRVFNKRTH